MTSWQEKKRLELLEKRRKEHEQYAAERLAKVNAICKLAWLNGMSYGQYIAERSKNMSDTPNVTPTAENTPTDTPTDTPTKRGIREPLPPEKVERVREMLAEGAKVNEIIAETLVSRATIDRIKNGTYGAKQPKRKEPAAVVPKVNKTSTDGVMRVLISRAVETLRDTQGGTPDDCALVGKALGLLEAAELILGDNAKI